MSIGHDAVPLLPQISLPPATQGVYPVPAHKRGILDWLSITLVTGALPGNRRLQVPYKIFYSDPPDTNTKINLQAANWTNTYIWGIGLPYSDALNQVVRTFTLPKNAELDADVRIALDPPGDAWIRVGWSGIMNDQAYISRGYREL